MLLVRLETPSPRGQYIVRHVLEIAGIPVRFVQGDEEFRSATGPKLNYGPTPIEGAYHVPSSGALEELPIRDPAVGECSSMRVLYPIGDRFDIFRASFYFLSLVDEVRCTSKDAHGRNDQASLFAVRKGFSEEPWIDRWALDLGRTLEKRWPGISSKQRRYSHVATMDMDSLLRYAGRPLSRAIGASVKEVLGGSFGSFAERWQVRSGGKPDPFIRAVGRMIARRDHVDRIVLFYLMRGNGAFDHAAEMGHSSYRDVLHRAAQSLEIGLHPSYGSSSDESLVFDERSRLEDLIQRPIRFSRQHFLRWKLPETLRSLVDQGFVEDHTLGYSDRVGFRASTCTPFNWYDLEREEETNLELVPFAAMDSAVIEQMGMEPNDLVHAMSKVSDAVRSVSGTFVSVWHDRYLSGHREFAPWPVVFDEVVQHARP